MVKLPLIVLQKPQPSSLLGVRVLVQSCTSLFQNHTGIFTLLNFTQFIYKRANNLQLIHCPAMQVEILNLF